MFASEGFLRWVYLARLTLAAGIFAAALLVWTQPQVAPEATLVATLTLVMSLGFTAGSFWRTHILRERPTPGFLYAQVLFDIVLVTAVVHMTGRGESDFVPLYVLVITEGALLLPLRGGFAMGALAILLYFADAVWGGRVAQALGGGVLGGSADRAPGGSVLIQVGLFGVIALATAWLGDRLRRAGSQLGEVESELRQLRLDTSDILATLDTGVVTVDSGGAVVYMNAAAETLLGMQIEDGPPGPGLHTVDRVAPGLAGVVQRTLTTGVAVARYETHSRVDSRLRVLGLRTTILERDERPWVTVVMQDITDARQAEAATRRAERLEAVAELAASLAHEIKNPLASIRSAVEQLTAQGSRLEKADRGVLAALVMTESDRLSRLLSGFLEFSRVEMRTPTILDLVAVVEKAVDVVRQHPDARNASPNGHATPVVIESDGRVTLQGDEDLLHRAIFNLVLNAVQHSHGTDEVRVELRSVGEPHLPPGAAFTRAARIRVMDRGSGIAAEDMARVLDPFFTTRDGGSGLGLALVQRAVDAHQGLLFIDSELGEGTTFTIFLPTRLEKAIP